MAYAKKDKIECPDPADPKKEGICPPDLATNNADTWAFIAAGVGWSKMCYYEAGDQDKQILYPDELPKRAVLHSRNPRMELERRMPKRCKGYYKDDSYLFDDGPDESD